MCDVHKNIEVHLIWNYDDEQGVERTNEGRDFGERPIAPFVLWQWRPFNDLHHSWGNLSFACGSSDLTELDSVTGYNLNA